MRPDGGGNVACGDSGSVPYVTRRGTARTTTDRSSRATRASPDRRGTRAPANPRSARVTTATRASLPPPTATGDTPPTSTPAVDAHGAAQPDPRDKPDTHADHRSSRLHETPSTATVP